MKDNVREALFNLIGAHLPGCRVFDLFAGSGAVGLEAISRGAQSAVLIEKHFPTARVIRDNIALLGMQDRASAESADAFFWSRQFLRHPHPRGEPPWVVFLCPPFELYDHCRTEIIETLHRWMSGAPPGSLLAVESDRRFDVALLPDAPRWSTREYSPARLSIYRVA